MAGRGTPGPADPPGPAEVVAGLCHAAEARVFRLDGDRLRLVSVHGPGRRSPVGTATGVSQRTLQGRALLAGRTVRAGSRLATPVLQEGRPAGVLAIRLPRSARVSPGTIRTLEQMAALIALPPLAVPGDEAASARDPAAELAEAREQQGAIADILRAISSSPTDLQPVLDAVVRAAARFCAASDVVVSRLDGPVLRGAAGIGGFSEIVAGQLGSLAALEVPVDRGSVTGRAAVDGRPVHVHDLATAQDFPEGRALQQRFGHRTTLATPLLREGRTVGVIALFRMIVEPFSNRQIELLRTFADQAVIAIENVRLFTELDARNHDLSEALEQQTATTEVLRLISGSPTDLQPIFDAVARNAARVCGARDAIVYRRDGDSLRQVAAYGPMAKPESGVWTHAVDRRSVTGRAVVDRRTVHVHDMAAETDPELADARSYQQRWGNRTTLSTPLVSEGASVGAITINRAEVRPFSPKQIALLETFAAQAVIAIENARLLAELTARNRDLTESLEQQTATGDILRVISGSPTDVQPVFDTIARSAAQLCEAQFCHLFRFDGTHLHFVAHHGLTPEGDEEFRRLFPAAADRGSAGGRAALSGLIQHISDVHADPEYRFGRLARLTAYRSIVAVPMVRDGRVIGTINVARSAAGSFSDRQLELLRVFADQAVIAVENVRLFTELETRNRDLTETLAQQTATGEILRVISSSPTDAEPVFDTIARNALRLCGATFSAVIRFDGTLMRLAALHGLGDPSAIEALRRAFPRPPGRAGATDRAMLTGTLAYVPDVLEDPEYQHLELARATGYRCQLSVPMLRDGQPVGAISLAGAVPAAFSEQQIALLRTFADQAVIAIENVRLFTELEARNRDLTETLKQQTATGEILRVISRSPTDVQPVFEIIAERATTLCDADISIVSRVAGELIELVSLHGMDAAGIEAVRGVFPMRRTAETVTARTIREGAVVHVGDVVLDYPEYETKEQAGVGGWRGTLGVPMLREGQVVGAIFVGRRTPGLFASSQVELLRTFADQAVIAIENVRLFTELETRTRDLTRSVRELRALGEVSQAVGSTLDLERVLETIVSRAAQLSGSEQGIAYEFDEPTLAFHVRATHEVSPDHLAALRATPIKLGEGAMGRAGLVREPVQVADIAAERRWVAPQVRDLLVLQGLRSLLAVPLIREGRLLGGLVILRREGGAFSPEVVTTLRTFAAQSVLAIHNARLFREIQRQQRYSEALVETSPVAIVTLDMMGKVTGWNPAAERLFGYPAGDAVGRPMEDLVATPEVRDDVRANIRKTLGGEWIRTIARRTRQDGTPVDVEISSMPVVVEGSLVGMIGIYHDITELLQARREAEAANEAKGAFLATMSHEIRTPMNAVIGMSGLLLGTTLTEEQREYAEVIRQSGDALLTVINDILDFSKIEAGRLELEAQPFEIRECVEGALDLVATAAGQKGLDLAYQVADGTPEAVVGDVTRLRQVLLNLLSNAVKFTERGEVVLSVGARRLEGPGTLHELTFTVRDTGIGIPPDRLGRLFRSFSQVDASTTRRYGGTGLGLAISRRLAEMMGGGISVTSEPGVGSEFRLTIQAAATEARGRQAQSGEQPLLRGKRVLVVDDNATNRRILEAHLAAWGMEARATEAPGQALDWIRDGERLDAGILDMHMPEMDGVALARAIRQEAAGASLPLILFSSLGRREVPTGEEWFAAYLHKPIKPSQLLDALAGVLTARAAPGPSLRPGRIAVDPGMSGWHPLRILLAEDNAVNQKVALRLLGQMGYRADLAANGLEAIEAVARQAYDVVLMDVQMPELDGFEASREITRRWTGSRRPRIVAMTANAMQGDRELCAAAGMDDYIAKPVRIEELAAALARCRPRSSAEERGAAAAPGPGGPTRHRGTSTPGGSAIDEAAFQRLLATTGADFVGELIETFLEDARSLLGALEQALDGIDLDAFRRAAHSLKSNGETLGATVLAAEARELEAQARAGHLEGAAPRLERLRAAFQHVVRDLEARRRGLAG